MDQNFNKLSKRKQEEVFKAREQAVQAGFQFMQVIVKGETAKMPISPEMRESLKFLLVDCCDLVSMGYEEAFYIARLGDPEKVEAFDFRMFNFFQQYLKTLKVTGRANVLKLYDAVQAFEEPGKILKKIQDDQSILAKEYNNANSNYGKICNQFGIMPDTLDEDIAKLTEEWKATIPSEPTNS